MKYESSHSVKPRATKLKSTSSKSETDLNRLRILRDSSIAITEEHPEIDMTRIISGIVRRGLKPVPAKNSISLRIDNDVLEWFKAQGDGYQTRMNAVLRAFKEASA